LERKIDDFSSVASFAIGEFCHSQGHVSGEWQNSASREAGRRAAAVAAWIAG
jgi:hypothetical protein